MLKAGAFIIINIVWEMYAKGRCFHKMINVWEMYNQLIKDRCFHKKDHCLGNVY